MDKVKQVIRAQYQYEKGSTVPTEDILNIFNQHKVITNPIILLNRLFSQTFKYSKSKKLIRNLAIKKDEEEEDQEQFQQKKKTKKLKTNEKKQNDDKTKSKERILREKRRKENREFKSQIKSKKKDKVIKQRKSKSKSTNAVNSTPKQSKSSIKIVERNKGDSSPVFSDAEDS